MEIAMTPLRQYAMIDTNVFVYALYPAYPQYQAAFRLREQAQDPEADFTQLPCAPPLPNGARTLLLVHTRRSASR